MIALWLWLSAALAGERLALGPTHVAVWTAGQGLDFYELARPSKPQRSFPIPGQLLDLAPWGERFVALLVLDGVRSAEPLVWVFDPGEGSAGQLQRVSTGPAGLSVDAAEGVLWLHHTNGDTLRVGRVEPSDGGFVVPLGEATPGPDLRWRTRRLLVHPGQPLVGVSGEGLELLRQEAGRVWRSARGEASTPGAEAEPLDRAAWVGPARLLSVDEAGTQATRWSLLHPWVAPWPFPLGQVTLPAPALALVPLPEGLWIVADAPLQSLPGLPGVALGLPEGLAAPRAVAWRVRGDAPPEVVFLTSDGALRRVQPPEVQPTGARPPGDAARLSMGDWTRWGESLGAPSPPVARVADALAHDDLPVGTRSAPGGSVPDTVRKTIEQLIAMATPLQQMHLIAARGYLRSFNDPSGELLAQIEAKEAELFGRTVTLWGGLLVAGSLAIWMWRWASRRVLLRDQVLASAWNPFRQDSPNNPSRTPFAANSLADDLLRTLDLNCVVVEGPQFSGKSALLRHVAWRLESEGLRGKPVRVVRMGLFGVPEPAFWTELGRGVAEAYPEHEASAEVLELSALDRGAVEYLLDEVLVEGAPRLVLVLDDLDALGLYRAEAQRFRGLLQVVPSHRMSVLGAGQSIRRGFAGDPDESPWFNLFQVRQLRPMSHDELLRYLESRLRTPFSFSSEAARRLHERTSGRPLQVWHVCFAAVEHLLVNRRFDLGADDIDAASQELRTLAGVFVTATTGPGEGRERGGSAEAAWERVVGSVAEARRRRADLLELLAEQRHREAEMVEGSFFEDDAQPHEGR